MTKNRKILVSLILLMIMSVGIYSIQQINIQKISAQEQVVIGTDIGQKAPEISLKDLSDKDVKLSDFKGKKIFLNFWASWCPPCQSEMPSIQKLDQNNPEVAVIAINIKESKKKVLNFMLSNGYSFRALLDSQGKVANRYLVRGIPTTYIIDKNGIIQDKHVGPLSYDQMLELLGL